MIDNVPLIQNANDAQQINASIIAMKKASRELDEKIVKLNSLNSELDKKIALLDSGLNKEIEDRKEAINSLDVASVGGSCKYISAISETDGKISATASDITSSVSSGNSQPVTSGGVANAIAPLQPINSVTSGNLQPVTSWAVYNALETKANKIKTSGETTIDKVYEKLDGSNVYLKNGMNQIAQNIASYTTGQFVDINAGGPRYCFVIYKLDNTYWSAELRSYQSAYNNIVFKFGHENTGYFGVKIY